MKSTQKLRKQNQRENENQEYAKQTKSVKSLKWKKNVSKLFFLKKYMAYIGHRVFQDISDTLPKNN